MNRMHRRKNLPQHNTAGESSTFQPIQVEFSSAVPCNFPAHGTRGLYRPWRTTRKWLPWCRLVSPPCAPSFPSHPLLVTHRSCSIFSSHRETTWGRLGQHHTFSSYINKNNKKKFSKKFTGPE